MYYNGEKREAKMAKRTKGQVEEKTEVKKPEAAPVLPVAAKMATVSFRTKLVLKKKAEGIFDEMGISMSAALNMFLSQVVREKGMPFTPNVQKKLEVENSGTAGLGNGGDRSSEAGFMALEELWDEL